MLIPPKKETLAQRMLERARDYGLNNPNGSVFDRIFNRQRTQNTVDAVRNSVGQSQKQLSYPNGMSPDGGFYSPTIGLNVSTLDPKRATDMIAQSVVQNFWKKNRERLNKYNRISKRGEVSEALDSICDEAIYPNEQDEICTLKINPDSEIGEAVKGKLHKIFRLEVLSRLMNFGNDGWKLMRQLLIEGRIFLEVVYNPETNKIAAVNVLPQQNMIIVVHDGIIVGYREMIEGPYSAATNAGGGKNYVDFSPNQILYADLGMYGPGGINDPRSILEEAVKPFNQLNAIEDAITMYRIQWGTEKLVFKIDTGQMTKAKAEKHMQDQAKVLSRRMDYNPLTGEISNSGRVIGIGEHFFLSTSASQKGSEITRIDAGDNINRIEDVKYFKRNLVNSMKVPPGHVSALAGDGQNYTNGKIGEVTQAEVAFARMVQRYQRPIGDMITRLFVMVLNTKSEFTDDIKLEEFFGVKFHKSNSFQLYIDAEVMSKNITTFDNLMKHVRSAEAKDAPISMRLAMIKGLRLTDAEMSKNDEWLEMEEKGRKST